jgi:hypothetical protein
VEQAVVADDAAAKLDSATKQGSEVGNEYGRRLALIHLAVDGQPNAELLEAHRRAHRRKDVSEEPKTFLHQRGGAGDHRLIQPDAETDREVSAMMKASEIDVCLFTMQQGRNRAPNASRYSERAHQHVASAARKNADRRTPVRERRDHLHRGSVPAKREYGVVVHATLADQISRVSRRLCRDRVAVHSLFGKCAQCFVTRAFGNAGGRIYHEKRASRAVGAIRVHATERRASPREDLLRLAPTIRPDRLA